MNGDHFSFWSGLLLCLLILTGTTFPSRAATETRAVAVTLGDVSARFPREAADPVPNADGTAYATNIAGGHIQLYAIHVTIDFWARLFLRQVPDFDISSSVLNGVTSNAKGSRITRQKEAIVDGYPGVSFDATMPDNPSREKNVRLVFPGVNDLVNAPNGYRMRSLALLVNGDLYLIAALADKNANLDADPRVAAFIGSLKPATARTPGDACDETNQVVGIVLLFLLGILVLTIIFIVKLVQVIRRKKPQKAAVGS